MPRRTTSAVFLAALVAWAGAVASVGAQSTATPGPAASGSAATYLYVCVQDEARIDVVDMATLAVVDRVDLTALGFSPNATPHHIAVTPEGDWFVSLIGENRVARFDRENHLLDAFEMSTPGMLAFESETGRLLVSRSMSAVNPPTRIGVIETDVFEGDEWDVFLPRPHPVAVSPDGRWAYTGSLGVNQLAAIELETEDVELVHLEGPPHALVQFAISPDGRWLVAGTEVSGRLLVFDRTDPARPVEVASVEIGPMVFDPVFAPDGQAVWVPVKGANEVAIVRAGDWTVTERIRGESLRQPHQIVFSPDGARAFVSNNDKADHMSGMPGHDGHQMAGHEGHEMPGGAEGGRGNVTVIDAGSLEVLEVIELGRNVTGLGKAPLP